MNRTKAHHSRQTLHHHSKITPAKPVLHSPFPPDKIPPVKNTNKSLIGRISLLSFVYESRLELKKVTWPTRKQVIRLSTIVIVASAATAAYLGALDYLFTSLLSSILK